MQIVQEPSKTMTADAHAVTSLLTVNPQEPDGATGTNSKMLTAHAGLRRTIAKFLIAPSSAPLETGNMPKPLTIDGKEPQMTTEIWNWMHDDRRTELLMKCGWTNRVGLLTPMGRRIYKTSWAEMSEAAKNVISKQWAKEQNV
jgi:hypothetical protein